MNGAASIAIHDASPVVSARAAGDRLDELLDRLLHVASVCFKTERSALSLASMPRDVPGWDSLAHLEFVCALEKEFSLQLTARDIMSLDRLDKALALVRRA